MTRTTSAAEADTMVGGPWFTGYTSEVVVHDEPVVLAAFDAQARADAAGDTEMVVFAGGLTVGGLMDLGDDVHSIVVVRGDLRVGALELGDAVLVVTGRAVADRYVHCRRHEGVFRAGPETVLPDDALASAADEPPAALSAPVLVWFNRGGGGWSIRTRDASGTLVERRDLLEHPELVDHDGEIDGLKARTALRAGHVLR